MPTVGCRSSASSESPALRHQRFVSHPPQQSPLRCDTADPDLPPLPTPPPCRDTQRYRCRVARDTKRILSGLDSAPCDKSRSRPVLSQERRLQAVVVILRFSSCVSNPVLSARSRHAAIVTWDKAADSVAIVGVSQVNWGGGGREQDGQVCEADSVVMVTKGGTGVCINLFPETIPHPNNWKVVETRGEDITPE